ncbi:hypothetical protein [Actinoplanes palleronii]|uniref:Uncharacterized protein n=1 Tax=Actinoplanes palleronii TaxID=113570 RepID=A0ABQ4BM71_9ACTN|nr:hypothetical protein [Actinoplanes palleronii]GIE71730.1 hypothetical protein Apa02nite_078380 [Actinoplanes palleronii]
MNPLADQRLRVLAFALAGALGIWGVLTLTDATMFSLLGLDPAATGDAGTMLGRLRLVFHLGSVLFVLLVIMALYRLVNRLLFAGGSPAGTGDTSVAIVDVDDGIKLAITAVSGERRPRTLRIWGYSLNFSSRLSQYFEDHPHPALAVEIFVPDESLIGSLFKDAKGAERASQLKMRREEWIGLATSHRVQSVQVFVQQTIPNDLGMMVDDRLALVHTYDWKVDGSQLSHKRQELSRRRFLNVSDSGETGRYVLEQLTTRFLCRSYDAPTLSTP